MTSRNPKLEQNTPPPLAMGRALKTWLSPCVQISQSNGQGVDKVGNFANIGASDSNAGGCL